jgi:hypothetical protein
MFWEFSQDNGELLGAINEHMWKGKCLWENFYYLCFYSF